MANYRKEFFAESSIIQCMLSSPEALLRYSLWSSNLKQAGQVIQVYSNKYINVVFKQVYNII